MSGDEKKDGARILGVVEPFDTAWPGEVELSGIEVLTTEQQQRRDAMYAAASVLEKRGPMGVVTPAPITELVKIANYILDGEPGL